MRTFFLFTVSALLFLVGCQKELLEVNDSAEELQTVTFQTSLENIATKAVADNDGAATSVNRCIMEVYYDNTFLKRLYSQVSDKKASFTTQLPSNRTYKVVFWADHVTSTSDLTADLYYTTNTDNHLKAITIKGDYLGNNDARDAFYHCGSYTVAQTGTTFSDISLKRPFAQINVITTDWTISGDDSFKPETVDVTFKNPNVNFNAYTGESSTDSNVTTLHYNTDIYTPSAQSGNKTLSMDYIFASATKEVIDIDWRAQKANNADVTYSLTNIPYQRNYRTNIKGNLLTTQGTWNVEIDPDWNTDSSGEFDVIVYVANTVADAQTIINDHSGTQSVQNSVEVQVKEEISSEKELYIPDNTTTPNWIFKIENMTSQGQITVKDENPTDGDVNYKNNVEVALPSGIEASKAVFNTPNAHCSVSGSFGTVEATTSTSTLEIKAEAVINNVKVFKGNVALYGDVTSIQRGEGNTSDVIVNIYDGAKWTNWATEKTSDGIKPTVNLGTYSFDPTGYNVAGSMVIANVGTPATWTVSVINEWKYYTAESFSNIDGTNITIMNAAELAKLSNEYATYKTYNIALGCNIDLSEHHWSPIPEFLGNFDGKGYTISGMTITDNNNNAGLFASVGSATATIKDVTISGANVSGKDNVGVLIGAGGLSHTISNVTVINSTVTGTGQYTGGICGNSEGYYDGCKVKDCTISGKDQVGGIVGYLWIGNVKNSEVSGCTITASSERAGGLIGKIQSSSGNSTSGFAFDNNTISGNTITAPDMAGGIAAQLMGDQNVLSIKNNTIDVTLSAPKKSPIAALRGGQPVVFTSHLEENITGNTWTLSTYNSDRYIYTNAETTAGDQIILNSGSALDYWQIHAANSFSTPISDNTIFIANAAELALFAKTYTSYAGYKVKLTANIDLSGYYWIPITGNNDFDGDNKVISGLNVKDEGSYSGFYSIAYNEIKNVKFTNATIKGVRAAVVAGAAGKSTFTNVSVETATVEGEQKCGGIIGFIAGVDNFGAEYTRLTGCSVKDLQLIASTTYSTKPLSDVNGASFGGLVGFGSPQNEITVTNCSVDNISFSGVLSASWYSDKSAVYYQYLSHPFIGALVTKESSANKGKGYESQVYTLTGNTVTGTVTTAQSCTCETSNAFLGFYYNDNIQPKATSQKTKLVIDGVTIPTDLSSPGN